MRVHPVLSVLLWPLSVIYGAVVRLRAFLYRVGGLRTHRLNGVVISVGNLTVGGTGKTPLVIWLSKRSIAEGKRPAILSRGYRAGPLYSSAPETLPSGLTKVSDEILLIATALGSQAGFGIGKNRHKEGRALEAQGFSWFILDDGFQHLALAREVNIALIDATDPPTQQRLLPAGRLREPLSALRRADIILVTRSSSRDIDHDLRRYSAAPIFHARTRFECVRQVRPHGEELTDWRRLKFVAFCGIGNPDSFFADLKAWGFGVSAERTFPDHHRYSRKDFDSLAQDLRRAGADALLCTEKDAVNLCFEFPGTPLVFACVISIEVDEGDRFWNEIKQRAGRSRPGGGG